jgi:hypothetical protein
MAQAKRSRVPSTFNVRSVAPSSARTRLPTMWLFMPMRVCRNRHYSSDGEDSPVACHEEPAKLGETPLDSVSSV